MQFGQLLRQVDPRPARCVELRDRNMSDPNPLFNVDLSEITLEAEHLAHYRLLVRVHDEPDLFRQDILKRSPYRIREARPRIDDQHHRRTGYARNVTDQVDVLPVPQLMERLTQEQAV